MVGGAALEALATTISTICSVSGEDTKAGACTVEGVAAKVFVGKEVAFVVTAVGYDGTPRTEGGDVVEVMFESASGAGGGGAVVVDAEEPPSKRRKKTKAGKAGSSKQKQKAAHAPAAPHVVGTVVDGGDGTYQCSFTPPTGVVVGEWQLTVQIGGVPIAGSPFAVEVSAGKAFVFDHITQGVVTGRQPRLMGKGCCTGSGLNLGLCRTPTRTRWVLGAWWRPCRRLGVGRRRGLWRMITMGPPTTTPATPRTNGCR
jgi:hypothetical protein